MRIKDIIIEKGWTISQLASQMKNRNGELGMSTPGLYQIINGNPTLDKLREIASIIGVSVSELVADDVKQERPQINCPHCGKSITLKIEEHEAH